MEGEPGAPPREQRKTDPGRRGCGLLETGTVVLFCFVFPRLWKSSSLLPLKSSPGASSEGSKVPSPCLLSFLSLGEQSVEGRWSLLGFKSWLLANLLHRLGPAAGTLQPTSLPVNKETGAPPDLDLPSSVIRSVNRRMDNRETQTHLEMQRKSGLLESSLLHPPCPHQEKEPWEAVVLS